MAVLTLDTALVPHLSLLIEPVLVNNRTVALVDVVAGAEQTMSEGAPLSVAPDNKTEEHSLSAAPRLTVWD